MRLFSAQLLVIASVTACGEPSGVAPGQDVLRLRVAVAQSTINVGDTTTATITLLNLSFRTVTVGFNSGCQILPYIGAQPSDEIVYPSGGHWFCTAAVTKLTLPPKSTRTLNLSIRGGVAEGTSATVALPPGQYLIHATLASREFPVQAEPASLTVQ